MAGTVRVEQAGFYGMSQDGVNQYIKDIKTNCIETAKNELRSGMESTLLPAIRTGWIGIAEENFEQNMFKLIQETIKALDRAQAALEQELQAVAKAWVDQDSEMVGRM